MERNNTFTIMLEELNYQEMSEILGGAGNFCDSLQEIANTDGGSWSDKDWDAWGESYETHCMN